MPEARLISLLTHAEVIGDVTSLRLTTCVDKRHLVEPVLDGLPRHASVKTLLDEAARVDHWLPTRTTVAAAAPTTVTTITGPIIATLLAVVTTIASVITVAAVVGALGHHGVGHGALGPVVRTTLVPIVVSAGKGLMTISGKRRKRSGSVVTTTVGGLVDEPRSLPPCKSALPIPVVKTTVAARDVPRDRGTVVVPHALRRQRTALTSVPKPLIKGLVDRSVITPAVPTIVHLVRGQWAAL